MAGSSGSFATDVPAGSPLARKLFSVALFAQTQKTPGFSRSLTGPAPTAAEANSKIKGQTHKGMPVVRITDLSKSAGDTVSVDVFGVIGGKPVMGDDDAEGTGAPLTNASMDIKIDLATKVVDVGGKMAQQRTVHQLRNIAMSNLVSYFSRLDDQTTLVHLAGARGFHTDDDWVVPLASDPDFASIAINEVKAPSFGAHWVADGNYLVQPSVANVGAIEPTDLFKLEHIDALSTMLDEMAYPLQPVKIADDPAAGDEPMWVLYVSPRQWSSLLGNTSSTGIRSFQQNAWNRASYGSKHPLFKGEVGMWNRILVKKANRPIRFNAGQALRHVVAADAATANETSTNIPAAVTAGQFAVDRAVLLGAQALGNAYGKNKGSDYHFDWLENPYNLGRALEIGGDVMGGKKKVRFNLNGAVRDHGVIALDTVVSLR